MLLGSQQQCKWMRNSAPEKSSRIPPWGNSNNNRAHDQSSEPVFLPLALSLLPCTKTAVRRWIPPCGHRGAKLSSAEEKERGGVTEGGVVEEKKEGATQPCVTNNQRSAAAALSTPALTVVAWRLLLKWEAFERHLSFVLLVPCSYNGEEPGGLVLVYHDSCSKAGWHDGVPAWMAALLQRFCADAGLLSYRVQLEHSCGPEPRWF